MRLYAKIANILVAIQNCEDRGNWEGKKLNIEQLYCLLEDLLPSGSGFDNGSTIVLDESNENKLVFETDFHHMNETGYYDGWTNHRVIVKPSLAFGFDLRITGRDRNGIKDYIADVFHNILNQEV